MDASEGGANKLPIFYNVGGDFRQLEFRVTLSSVEATPSRFEADQCGNSELPFDRFASFGERGVRVRLEERTIRWQEHIPRPSTVAAGEGPQGGEEVPTGPGAPVRPIGALSHRLFTLLETELEGSGPSEVPNAPTEQQQRSVNVLGGSVVRQRKVVPGDSALREQIQLDLPQEQRRRSRTVKQSEQKMRIMAYLGAEDVYEPSEEHTLWELRLLNGRQISAEPGGFERERVLRAKMGVFSARMATVESVQFDGLEEEKKTLADWAAEEEEGGSMEFEVPERSGDYWLHYLVQIGKGLNFPHDNLLLEWQLELSGNVRPVQPDWPTKGLTQRCSVKAEGTDDVAHFGHLIEFTLCYRVPSDCAPTARTWPRLLLRVTAEDGWGRSYVDGYATMSLPITPGCSPDIALECWRPVSRASKMCELYEAHLGQAVDLLGIELAGARDDAGKWSSLSSKVGIGSEAGGTLTLRVHCVHQLAHYIPRDTLRSLKYSTMLRNAGGISGDLQSRIAKVLQEFEHVRRQLMRVRSRRRGQRRMLPAKE